jgi:hypothetical protein
MGIKFILVCYSFLKTILSSYILINETVDFTQAVKKCDSINATVLLIDNSAEDDFIKNNYLNNNSVKDGI